MTFPTLGVNAKAYYLSTGTRTTWSATVTDGANVGAAPSNLTEITNLKGDLNVPLDDGEADVSTRGNGPWEAVIGGIRKVGIDLTMIYDPSNTIYQAFLKAYLTRTKIACAFLGDDKATVGAGGLWADFAVTKMEKGEAAGEAQTTVWTLKPTYSTVPPEWVKVSA